MDPHQHWQAAWHRIFDEDPGGLGPTPSPMPPVAEDHRLSFGLWRVAPETRRRALEVLPQGEILADRVEVWEKMVGQDLSPEAAMDVLRDGLARLAQYPVEGPEPGSALRFLAHGTEAYRTISMQVDAVTFGVNEEFPGIGRAGLDAPWLAVYRFTREPFYRAANDYNVANWFFWPLSQTPDQIDVYAPFVQLSAAGYATGWHGDGSVYLFDHRPEE